MFYIERNSPVPVYYQVMGDIKTRIRNNEWGPKDKLPTEIELSDYYGISRITLRQAITELIKEGLLIKRRGSGTFINELKIPMVTTLSYSLSTTDARSHKHIETTILDQMKLVPTESVIRKKLKLEEGESVIYIKRLISIEKSPVAVSRAYIPLRLVPDLDKKALLNNSISQSLKKYYELEPILVKDNLEAVRATQAESRILNNPIDSPLMLVEGLSFYAEDKPLEYSYTLWTGDSVRFEILLERGYQGLRPLIH